MGLHTSTLWWPLIKVFMFSAMSWFLILKGNQRGRNERRGNLNTQHNNNNKITLLQFQVTELSNIIYIHISNFGFQKGEFEIHQCTKVHFASLLSGGFTTMAVMNSMEKRLANCTSVQCGTISIQPLQRMGCIRNIPLHNGFWRV